MSRHPPTALVFRHALAGGVAALAALVTTGGLPLTLAAFPLQATTGVDVDELVPEGGVGGQGVSTRDDRVPIMLVQLGEDKRYTGHVGEEANVLTKPLELGEEFQEVSGLAQ